MEKIKKLLNLQNVLILIGIIVSFVLACVFSSIMIWLVFFSAVFGMLSSVFASNGKWIGFVCDIISYAIYIYICIRFLYYGELILSVLIIIFHIFSIFQWKSNEKDGIVVVNDLKKKEIYISILTASILCVLYIIVLYFIGSEYPILNGIATIVYILGNYFSYRRNISQFFCMILYEIAFIVLWLLSLNVDDVSGYIFLIGGLNEMICAIMGIYNWKRIKEKQKE